MLGPVTSSPGLRGVGWVSKTGRKEKMTFSMFYNLEAQADVIIQHHFLTTVKC